MKIGENRWDEHPNLKLEDKNLPPNERIKFSEPELKALEIKYQQNIGNNFSNDWLSTFSSLKFGIISKRKLIGVEQPIVKLDNHENSKLFDLKISCIDIKITK